MGNIIVTITQTETLETYTIEANEQGGGIIHWDKDRLIGVEDFSASAAIEVLDSVKQLAHSMNMHDLCGHDGNNSTV